MSHKQVLRQLALSAAVVFSGAAQAKTQNDGADNNSNLLAAYLAGMALGLGGVASALYISRRLPSDKKLENQFSEANNDWRALSGELNQGFSGVCQYQAVLSHVIREYPAEQHDTQRAIALTLIQNSHEKDREFSQAQPK